jgi:hypothetical protein
MTCIRTSPMLSKKADKEKAVMIEDHAIKEIRTFFIIDILFYILILELL